MKKFLILIGSIIVCFLPGIIGRTAMPGEWYAMLEKPVFNPPDRVFAPAWTALYFLMGISLYLVLIAEKSGHRKLGITFFSIQLILNGLWSIVFFGFNSILGALFVIILLLVFIILSMMNFYKVSKPAAYILVPYLIWVSFATILNFSIYQLNI